MKSLVALIKREYLEHRGAFLYAPAVILLILAIILVGSIGMDRFRMGYSVGAPPVLKIFEFGFLGVAMLWGAYLLATLFFYYADAFSADRRNNAMLFWKSMPVSDFKVLASKMLAGMTILPAMIYVALLITAALIFIGVLIGATIVPLVLPNPLDFLSSGLQIAAFVLVALALGLLWYAPFFAWVGALSTVFRRWSIPLAFLIPGLVGLAENMIFEDTGRPNAGYVLTYLRQRFHFGPDEGELTPAIFSDRAFDFGIMVSRLIASIDWAQMVGGLILAALLVYAASEYRRRSLAT
jgi:ABC-2 type transport system permease protein